MSTLLDDVNELLNQNKGDHGRLQHIKKSLEENKTVYVSDRQYVTNLMKKFEDENSPKSYSSTIKYSEKTDDELYSDNENMKGDEEPNTSQTNSITPPISANVNSFCGKCGNKIKNENFCTKCGSSVNSNNIEKDILSNDNIPPKSTIEKQQKTHGGSKKRKLFAVFPSFIILIVIQMAMPFPYGLGVGVILGIVSFFILGKVRRIFSISGIILIIFSSGIFFIPITENGMSVADMSNLCKGALGMIGQAFGGEQAQSNCSMANTLVSLATLGGIAGLISIIYGIIKKK